MEQALFVSPDTHTNNFDVYLEAKRNFGKRKSVISQEKLKIIKS